MNSSACSIRFSNLTFTRSLNHAAENTTVENGKLTLRSGPRCDNFRDPDGKLSNDSAPILLTEIDNRQPFTLTARVTPTFNDRYDAGTLFIYANEDLWFKFAMEMDERRKTRIVTVRTIETSDDNDHDVITERSVIMKISSDMRTIGFYYSLDGRDWQLIRLFRNDYPAALWIGLSAQSPLGDGNTVLLEEISLTPKSITNFRMGL
jgi:regulation of enolase protein 1 (concanavalin A-like superfamily)